MEEIMKMCNANLVHIVIKQLLIMSMSTQYQSISAYSAYICISVSSRLFSFRNTLRSNPTVARLRFLAERSPQNENTLST